MNAENLNRWLTLGANIGVLAGIVLILIELNQNSELMRAQMTQARADNVLEAYREQMNSDAWVEIRAKRRKADSVEQWIRELTPTEFERVFYYTLHEFHSVRTQFSQYREGLIDESIWEHSAKGQARRLVELIPHMPFSGTTDPEFRAFLNQMAVDAGLPPLYSGE